MLTHGNVRVSLTRDTTEDEVDGFLGGAARGGRRAPVAGGPVTGPDDDRADGSGARLPRACSARCRSSSWPEAIAEVPVGALVAVLADDVAARTDVPAWCRMRGQEYVGEEAAPDGTPRYVVRRLT